MTNTAAATPVLPAGPKVRAPYAAAAVAAAAMLLATAALLKAYQAVAMPAVGPLGPRLLGVALIEYELALAGLLALNVWPRFTWGLATATFTVFAGVSVRKWIAGAAHCGCFGPVYVDPRVTAVLDASIVLLLLWLGPRPRPLTGGRWRAAIAATAVLMLAAGAAAAYPMIPKPGLAAADAEYDFGKVAAVDAGRCEHVFLVHNRGGSPIRVTGYKSSCGCTVAELPAGPIPPGGSAQVRVRADWSGVAGTPYARVTLHTDSMWTPRVPLVIRADVQPAM